METLNPEVAALMSPEELAEWVQLGVSGWMLEAMVLERQEAIEGREDEYLQASDTEEVGEFFI